MLNFTVHTHLHVRHVEAKNAADAIRLVEQFAGWLGDEMGYGAKSGTDQTTAVKEDS